MREKFHFKKKYGQNFLQDNNILNNILKSVDITDNDLVIEIGPGSGALTEKIIEKTKKVICYEIDTELEVYLSLQREKGAKIIYGDFLKQDVNKGILELDYNRLYIIGNLPYYITTPIITTIIQQKIPVFACVFMVQKEVAERLVAQKSTKEYNSLTIFMQYYFKVEKMFDVSKNVFFPKPNVDSSVIRLTRREKPLVQVKSEETFFKLIKDCFQYKRKTIKNNLKNYDLNTVEEVLRKHNYNLSVRAEALPIDIFAEIANHL